GGSPLHPVVPPPHRSKVLRVQPGGPFVRRVFCCQIPDFAVLLKDMAKDMPKGGERDGGKTLAEIRRKYLEFFKAPPRSHVIVPSAPLVPENDPTTLFTGSGMQPMVPYLLGAAHPEGTRIADSQKSFRTVDIEEVGDNRHTTFFEMLGNWSLG